MTTSVATRCRVNDAEILAHEILESYNINSIPVNPLHIAKKLGIKVYSQSFITYNGDKVSGAISKSSNNDVRIIINEADSYKRKRFTIAHELGHFFMHMNNEEEYERVDMLKATGYNTRNQEEIEANNFAAALLMDKYMIYENFDVVKNFKLSTTKTIEYLADQFEVSRQDMEYRLINLGLI